MIFVEDKDSQRYLNVVSNRLRVKMFWRILGRILSPAETFRNKGIGDAGSTADIGMLWSAIVCLGLLWSALDLVCYSLPWTWSAIDASHLTSSFAPFGRSGR